MKPSIIIGSIRCGVSFSSSYWFSDIGKCTFMLEWFANYFYFPIDIWENSGTKILCFDIYGKQTQIKTKIDRSYALFTIN